MRRRQRGQVLIIVAVWLIALIGSAALILLTGSVEWQRNQLQQLADQAALDSALQIGVGCSAGAASTVIAEADDFLASQRSRTGTLSIGAGSCSAGYTGTDTFAAGLTASIRYPYRRHQQQVEVTLTLALPISFGNFAGASSTNVTRRAVAQQLAASVPAVTAGRLSCSGGQFNVGGSILTSNAIALGGGCAVYAHGRLDPSSTYSDVGDVDVYANGQAWTTGGGSCVANADSGSTNAICADGHELSGHTATACGTNGTTAFLVAADALVNPNPCAAGTGSQPVAPVSVVLPPEPDADPAAIATLRNSAGGALGSSCSAAGVYPNLSAGGTVVGTGLAPAPVQDASGFWHFKPSCYGYLDLASMASGIASTQIGTAIGPVRHFVTPTLAAASAAGTLLVATINCLTTPNVFQAPASWTQAAAVNQAGSGRTEIWYYADNPGGVSSATFTINPANIDCAAQMTEWSGVDTAAPLDQSGGAALASSTSGTISTSGATGQGAELVITADGFNKGVGGQTFARGAGWTTLAGSTANGFASEYRLDLPAGVASETVTGNPATPWSLTIATFRAGTSSGGAVLDPGFYHFNGSGFGGGGGICLNGGTLLAEDVTLEFVNQAGFSTGTCAPGGGASCTASSCQFGSQPCSVSACPPNAQADPAGGGYTWFAAPCPAAPDAGSCSASSWCPTGDRACSNLLVWAPATSTGQVAIKGTAAEHWMLGSVYWPGTCTDTVNGSSRIDGTIACGTLDASAAAGAGIAVGSDYGISTAIVETVLVE